MTSAPDGGPDKRSADRNRQLVDLAADVRKARGETASLKKVVVDLASTVSEWGPSLADAQRDIANLRGAVEELVTGQAEADNPPVDWFALPAEDAEREWPKLGQWVHEVLGGWYLVSRAQLPDCWALHRPAFLQVAWLRSSHVEAYLSRSHPSQAAEWNVRWLEAALARIKEYIPDTGCRPVTGRPGEHLVDQLEAQQSRVRGLDQMRQQAADLRERVTQPAGDNPYPNPYATQQAPAAPAPATAAPRPTGSTAGQDVISWDYWGGYFQDAMAADLAWRRERDAQQAQQAEQAAAEQADDEQPSAEP